MQSGDIEKALKYFLKADKLYNNKPRLWIVIAQCYMGLMLFPAAADYLTALLEHPDIPEYEKPIITSNVRFARWPFVTQKLVSRTWKQEESAIRNFPGFT